MAKDLMEDGPILERWYIKDMTEWFLEQPIRTYDFAAHEFIKQTQFICGFFHLVLRRPSFCFGDCVQIQILLQNNWRKLFPQLTLVWPLG
jgi:hypothetical protein